MLCSPVVNDELCVYYDVLMISYIDIDSSTKCSVCFDIPAFPSPSRRVMLLSRMLLLLKMLMP